MASRRETIQRAAKRAPNPANVHSAVIAFDRYGALFGLGSGLID